MAADVDLYQQITLWAAAGAHGALACDADGLAVVHAGGDVDHDPLVLADLALAPAGGAGILDGFSRAAAGGAGGLLLHGAEGRLADGAGIAGAVAGRAGLRRAAVGRAGAAALAAVLDPGGGDLLLASEGGFLKGEGHAGVDVLTLSRTAAPGGA